MDRNRRLFLTGLAAGALGLIAPYESFAYTPLPFPLVSKEDHPYAQKAKKLATYIATYESLSVPSIEKDPPTKSKRVTQVIFLSKTSFWYEPSLFSLRVVNYDETNRRILLTNEEDQLNIAFESLGETVSLEDKGLRGMCSRAELGERATKKIREILNQRKDLSYDYFVQNFYQITLDHLLHAYETHLV